MARIDVTPIIENTRMEAYYNSSNVLRTYFIYPNEGYVLHDTQYDEIVLDDHGNETGEVILGYLPYPSFVTVMYNYDFVANPRELYCVPADTVPADQIFNNGNDHEVMNVETDTETE